MERAQDIRERFGLPTPSSSGKAVKLEQQCLSEGPAFSPCGAFLSSPPPLPGQVPYGTRTAAATPNSGARIANRDAAMQGWLQVSFWDLPPPPTDPPSPRFSSPPHSSTICSGWNPLERLFSCNTARHSSKPNLSQVDTVSLSQPKITTLPTRILEMPKNRLRPLMHGNIMFVLRRAGCA